jgi:hypothetical protein
LKPAEQVDAVVRYYLPILKRTPSGRSAEAAEDLEHFTTIAERYRSLDRLLSDMALEPPNDSVGDVLAVDREEGMLTLSRSTQPRTGMAFPCLSSGPSMPLPVSLQQERRRV